MFKNNIVLLHFIIHHIDTKHEIQLLDAITSFVVIVKCDVILVIQMLSQYTDI